MAALAEVTWPGSAARTAAAHALRVRILTRRDTSPDPIPTSSPTPGHPCGAVGLLTQAPCRQLTACQTSRLAGGATAMSDVQQEVRRILTDVARAIDRRLTVEVREVPGQERLHLTLSQAGRHAEIELAVQTVLDSAGSSVNRNELRLRVKRAADTMLFRKMPDHRVAVKPLPPPGGQTHPRGPGR